MANHPPIQMNPNSPHHHQNYHPNRNRSAFAGLKRNHERRQRSPHAVGVVNNEEQKLILPKSPMSGQTPDW